MKKQLIILLLFISSVLTAQEYANVDLHSEVTHVQPMTGIVFWTDNASALNALEDKVQLEFSYLIYSDVIQEKDTYDWSSVDAILEKTANNRRQAVLRFRYTYPGETIVSVPNYIVNSEGYNNRTEMVEGSNTFIPDWSNVMLQNFTKEFFTEFAKRYDNDARLAFVQVGFGSYSEYHLYDGPELGLGNYFPSKAYQTTFLNHVDSVFENTQWSISIDAAASQYSPIESNSDLVDLSYGLFDDSFLHSTHSQNDTEYNRKSWLSFGANRSDTKVAGGELNYYTANDQENALTLPDGPNGTPFEELATLYDITYMIGNDQFGYQTPERIEQASLSTGYHFKVTEFRTNGNSTIVKIENTGIAPMYYDAYPTVNGIRSEESLKGLIKGASKTFTVNSGAINEDLIIESDRLVAGQEIQFDANLDKDVTLGTEESIFTDELITVYPNPFKDKITIKNTTDNIVEVYLYTILGTLIDYREIKETDAINTAEYKEGTYVVKIVQKDFSKASLFIKR